jgi:hypothetical protein
MAAILGSGRKVTCAPRAQRRDIAREENLVSDALIGGDNYASAAEI